MSNIRVQNICPPIPIRSFDWVAWIDGEEETGPYGYGKTEKEARYDLAREIADGDDDKFLGIDPMNYAD